MVYISNMSRQVRELIVLAMCAAISGCVSTGVDVASSKSSPYRPDESGRNVWTWRSSGAGSGTGTAVVASGTNVILKTLQKADRVKISLMGIPVPEIIENVVNDFGLVTLPLIGSVKVEGMTTDKAEKLIQQMYIQKEFYKTINVSVVSQDGELFVSGEVQKQGAIPLSGEVTLTQAIIMAGGFTDFAKKEKVELKRGRNTIVYDTLKIKSGEAEDPLLKNGDTIHVPRRWI